MLYIWRWYKHHYHQYRHCTGRMWFGVQLVMIQSYGWAGLDEVALEVLQYVCIAVYCAITN